MPVSDDWSRDEVPTSDAHCFLAMYLDVRSRQPPSEKVHQIIARTALFVSRHGGQSEIVLRVKQGSNPTFGFLMPDHRLHSYYRYLVDHPELLKDGAGSEDTDKDNKMVNSETEQAPSGGALSLLGAVYDSGDEDEGTVPPSTKVTDPENVATSVQGHGNNASIVLDNKESRKDQKVAAESAGKPILMKKNPSLTGNSIVAAQQEKSKGTIAKSQNTKSGLSEAKEVILEPPSFLKRTMEKIVEFIHRNGKEFEQKLIDQDRGRYPFLLSSNLYHSYYLKMLQETQENTKSRLSETKEMILEPPSFLKSAMEKIVEFILRNGKEFEQKLIDQDRTTGRFPFLLSSNPYHSYYLKMLKETEESKSRGRSPENKDRRNSAERNDRSPSERRARSSSECKDISHGKQRARSMERPTTAVDARISNRSSAEPSEKQPHDQQGKFQVVVGVKKEPPRKVTADEAAAIVMAATRGLGTANDSRNTLKEREDSIHNLVSNDHSSSFGSFSSLQGRDAPSKHNSYSEADTSLTSSGQLTKEGTGTIDDDWIASTIAKAAAVAASKEADSSEATMTKEQKLKAERLRRAKMFAAIIKSGGSKMNDLAAAGDPTNESAKPLHSDDTNVSTPDLPPAVKEQEGSSVPFETEGSIAIKEKPAVKEREGSSVPFEREGSIAVKEKPAVKEREGSFVPFEREGSIAVMEKDTDDERNRMRKYRKKHCPESDEDKNDSEESYKPSRKRHRSEHSRDHSKDVHKHKHRSKDRESRHRRHHYNSSEDEHEHRSSKSRHRHRGHDHYSDGDDDGHRRSRKHRRDHRSSSKRNSEDDLYQTEQTPGRSEACTPDSRIEPKPPTDTAQPSDGATEVPNELRAKIRAMLLETL